MTTAQDQQSRAEFERERVRHFKPGGPIAKALERYADGGYVDRRTEFAWAIWQAARALPAGMEPVGSVYTMQALVPGGREVADVTLHQQLPAGTKLYTAAQVLTMGRVPPGWQAVPVEPTDAMYQRVFDEGYYHDKPEVAKAILRSEYQDMLAAAPRPPAAQELNPLTDTQIDACSRAAHEACEKDSAVRWFHAFARAIEEKARGQQT